MKTSISTYKGPGFNRKTVIIISNGGNYGSTYREGQIWVENGQLRYNITDGYEYLDINRPIRNNLKSAINIIEGKICATPWYAK